MDNTLPPNAFHHHHATIRRRRWPRHSHNYTFLQWRHTPHKTDGDSDLGMVDVIFTACEAEPPTYIGGRIGIEGHHGLRIDLR